MTDKQIKEVLNSRELAVIEDQICIECKTYVNKEFIDSIVNILRREISNSGLSIKYIQQQLTLKKDAIIEFGIRLYNALKDKPNEEEYPVGEEIPKSERPKIIASHGLAIGFAVKYAIYLHFLESNPTELIDYLKKERVPKAQKFCKTLQKIYNS